MKLSKFSSIAALVLACNATFAQDIRVIAVETSAPALTAEQTEAQVTKPLEESFSKIVGVLEIRSSSEPKRSYIEVYSKDQDVSGLLTRVRLAAVKTRTSLPRSVEPSTVSISTQPRLR